MLKLLQFLCGVNGSLACVIPEEYSVSLSLVGLSREKYILSA